MFGHPTLLPVSGTVELPAVVLHWDEGGLFTANAVLSANGDTLSGTMTAVAGRVVPFGPYIREH